MKIINAFSVDVESWFETKMAKKYATPDILIKYGDRVVDNLVNTVNLLKLLHVGATFFVIGKWAEKYPFIVKKIEDNGFEIASHGYTHDISSTTPLQIQHAMNSLKNISKNNIHGFRSPNFQFNDKVSFLQSLHNSGFKYDSSIKPPLLYNPFGEGVFHSYKYSCYGVTEYPPSTFNICFGNLPFSGGFYLRCMPLNIIINLTRRLNDAGIPVLFYIHTWELDEYTPVIKLPFYRHFVQYSNLKSVIAKLREISSEFKLLSVRDVLFLAFVCYLIV